jgi:hypothetical protein
MRRVVVSQMDSIRSRLLQRPTGAVAVLDPPLFGGAGIHPGPTSLVV